MESKVWNEPKVLRGVKNKKERALKRYVGCKQKNKGTVSSLLDEGGG